MAGLLDFLAGSSDPGTADPTTGLVDAQRKQLAYGILGQTGAALLAAGAPTMPGSGQQSAALAQLGNIPGNLAQQQSQMVQQNAMAQREVALRRENQQQVELQKYTESPEFRKELEGLPPVMKGVAMAQLKGGDIKGVLATIKESRVQTAPINLGSGNVGFKQPDGGYIVHNSTNMTTMKFGPNGEPIAANYTSGAPVDPSDDVPNEDGFRENWLQKAVPQEYQARVRQIGEGRDKLPQGARGINAQIAAWANIYNPKLDATTFTLRNKAAADYAPSGVEGKAIISLSTLLQHGARLRGKAEALDNTDYPAVNEAKNQIDYATGGGKITGFNQVRDLITKELDTLVSGGRATIAETHSIRENIQHAQSPEQLQQAIDEIAHLATDRLQSATRQGQVALGKKHMQDLSEQLQNPEAMKAYQEIQANPIKNSPRWKAQQAAKTQQAPPPTPEATATAQGQPPAAQPALPPGADTTKFDYRYDPVRGVWQQRRK